jgi:hypothetical protein
MRKSNLRELDFQKVAELDAHMWRSYYNHQFVKMFFQLVRLMRSQLHLTWILTLRLAYYSGIAATNYRLLKGEEDYPRVLKNLNKFYKVISDNAIEPFDYENAAKLELEWWDIHRYPKKYKKSLESSLAEAAAAIYNVAPSKLKDYARYRAVAMMLPHHEGDKQPKPPDWNEIKDLLVKSWQSLHKAIQI